MLEELINGNRIPKILCLGSRDTKCSETFDDSIEIPNIILIFEHLKVFHPPIYEYYTTNIHKWFVAQPEKVNNFFFTQKGLEVLKDAEKNYLFK